MTWREQEDLKRCQEAILLTWLPVMMILIEILIFDSSQKVSRGNSTHPWLPIFGDDDFDVYFSLDFSQKVSKGSSAHLASS